MALVRISKQLIQDVESRIRDLRNAEVNEVPRPPTELQAATGDGVEPLATHVLWGEHLHLKSQMPSDWVKRAKRPQFNTLYTHDSGTPERTCSITFEGADVPVPPGMNVGYNSTVAVQVPYFLIEEAVVDERSPFHTVATRIMDMVNHEKRARKINQVWTGRQGQITLFLNKCKSLNEAIKLWPEIQLYVPRSYINTVEALVVRAPVTRKEQVLTDVNTDDLTAAAIAAKLAGVL